MVAYEQRKGHLYDIPETPFPGTRKHSQNAFDAFCGTWLALADWLRDASDRDIYPNRMHIVCMDQLHYPLREGIWTFESDLLEVKEQIENRDLDALMSNESVACYITWMREHREIFEFVDSVGHYDSGWWLGSGAAVD